MLDKFIMFLSYLLGVGCLGLLITIVIYKIVGKRLLRKIDMHKDKITKF